MTGRSDGPTRGAVILFITVFAAAVLLSAAGTAVAVWQAQQGTAAANREWCTVLDLLTRKPVTKPADPVAKPAREAQFELYQDFVQLKRQFGCGS